MNLTEKILGDHLVEGKMVPGGTIGIHIEQTLTQDATGTMTYLQFEAMDVPAVRTELSVSYVDHNTLQVGFENADDHNYLADVAAKYGIRYSRGGNGICHQVHLERFACPGKTLLGADSHTPTAGGIGSFALGAGGIDVAAAMGGAPYFLQMPKVMNIRLHGKLRPWVSAKDVILKVLSLLTTKGNVGIVIEYSGSALGSLTIPERATITNMGAELGVTTSIFPSDDQTLRFLRAQGREKDFVGLHPDEDARYDKVVDIDLADLQPMVAGPHSPDNVTTVAEIAGRPVDQVCIGSCTNASFKDIATVAGILEGRTVHKNVSLLVVPGSRQVWQMASNSGALGALAAAGARVLEPTCGFCIGSGQSPGSSAVSVRTNNRNFEGRSGTKDAKVYLVSPETAAVSALTGKLTDPSSFADPPVVIMPEKFLINDNMIVVPPHDASSVKIRRGPNIGDPPKIEPFPESFRARVSIVVGDMITTDHIMPAGSRLIYRSNIEKYSRFVFEGIDPVFPERCRDNRSQGFWNVIVAGTSYGQGSSREHAALCPAFLGVRAVIAGSFERIHANNLINFGILPLRPVQPDYHNLLSIGDEIAFREIRKDLFSGGEMTVCNETKGIEFSVICELTDRQKQIVMAGGLLNFMKNQRAG